MSKPLIMVDVDGVLIPTYARRKPPGYSAHNVVPSYHGVATATKRLPQRVWLNRKHGAWLKALDTEMNWATAWEGAANQEIGSRIGLPRMPHVTFSNLTYSPNPDMSHWKLDDLFLHADGRPFVWLDDGITGADTVRAALEYPAPALLYRVDPRWGLSADDLRNVWYWLQRVKG